LASSFLISPFRQSALISVDGSGDFVSTMTAVGNNNRIEVLDTIYFPHSLGSFYQAITQYLGFLKYGDEYKVMGLAPYGKPAYLKEMEEIVKLKDDNTFELNLKYFRHHESMTHYNWSNSAPSPDILYSQQLMKLLGPQRNAEDEITQRHKDISRSLQIMYENIFFHLLNTLFHKSSDTNLCISGGCGMNSVANGKVFTNTPFRKVYVPANAGDGGGSIGAAYYLYNQLLHNCRRGVVDHAFWGPSYSDTEVQAVLNYNRRGIEEEKCRITRLANLGEIALYISLGKVVGWFQGRMEWGPRALGNRSIICDARRKDMKAILNEKIKRREGFRPFAPSVLREYVNEYFETDSDVPFMSQVFQVKEDKRSVIPAVTHVDGSGRLQTVARQQNPLYYDLIEEFRKITGVPIVLNTSFNENEPIVNTPQEALDCFLRTKMDVLVLNNVIVVRV
jgi:carbamoyltransferase